MIDDIAALKADMMKATAIVIVLLDDAEAQRVDYKIEDARKQVEDLRKQIKDSRIEAERFHQRYAPNVLEIARLLAEPPLEPPQLPKPKRGRGRPKGPRLWPVGFGLDESRFQIIEIFRHGFSQEGHPERTLAGHPSLSVRDCIRIGMGTSPVFPEEDENRAGHDQLQYLAESVSRGKDGWKKFLQRIDDMANKARGIEAFEAAQSSSGKPPSCPIRVERLVF